MMTSLLLHPGFALLCAGVGLKVAATNPDYELKTKYRALLGVSVSGCLFLLQVRADKRAGAPPHHTAVQPTALCTMIGHPGSTAVGPRRCSNIYIRGSLAEQDFGPTAGRGGQSLSKALYPSSSERPSSIR
jgi:hypothetical protein